MDKKDRGAEGKRRKRKDRRLKEWRQRRLDKKRDGLT